MRTLDVEVLLSNLMLKKELVKGNACGFRAYGRQKSEVQILMSEVQVRMQEDSLR
jgi:hypothetical protein